MAPSASVSSTFTRSIRGVPEWAVALAVAVAAATVATVPRIVYDRFYYGGDMLESFVPSWHRIGGELLAGRWLAVNPDAWIGGNYAGEAAYGLYNPVNLANYMLAAKFENLSVASFVIMAEFLALFALGTYLLCREYGARRGAAVLAGLTIPFSGFTLFYEAAGWPSGMMAIAWVTLFWWSALRLSRGRTNPLITFLIGALTVSMGNPYAALGAVVILLGLGIGLLVQREFFRLLVLVITGACAGTAALVTYLPLFLSVDVTTRAGSTGIFNDTFLQPQIGGPAGMSSPSYLPVIMTFGGPVEVIPSLYLAWFVLPLLPWLPWGRIRALFASPGFRRAHGRPLVSLAIITVVYFLFTFGPSNVGMFRWPIRLVEYLYLCVVIGLSLALSLGLARDRVRRRATASAVLIALGFYLAFASSPALTGRHALFTLLVAALCAIAYVAWRTLGPSGLVAALVLGTVAVTAAQVWSLTHDVDRGSRVDPSSTSLLSAQTDRYQGTVLQLADLGDTSPEDVTAGRILFGNEIMASSAVSSINAYTGIGFTEFQEALCMDYRGAVCPGVYGALWQPVNADIPIPLIDYLRVSTLVVEHRLVPEVETAPPPPGWHVTERSDSRTVLQRDRPLPLPGRVSFASDGVRVLSSDTEAATETVRVTGSGGTVSFARLAWPGYSATVDGEPVDATAGWHGLLEVSVPPGDHELVVTFRPPRQNLSVAAFGAATVVVLILSVVDAVVRRRKLSAATTRTT
nr:YfhO family protein [Rhodococcus koreensis]